MKQLVIPSYIRADHINDWLVKEKRCVVTQKGIFRIMLGWHETLSLKSSADVLTKTYLRLISEGNKKRVTLVSNTVNYIADEQETVFILPCSESKMIECLRRKTEVKKGAVDLEVEARRSIIKKRPTSVLFLEDLYFNTTLDMWKSLFSYYECSFPYLPMANEEFSLMDKDLNSIIGNSTRHMSR